MFGPESFFHEDLTDDAFGAFVTRMLRDDLLAQLARSPLGSTSDAEAAAALARLLRDELERTGTASTP